MKPFDDHIIPSTCQDWAKSPGLFPQLFTVFICKSRLGITKVFEWFHDFEYLFANFYPRRLPLFIAISHQLRSVVIPCKICKQWLNWCRLKMLKWLLPKHFNIGTWSHCQGWQSQALARLEPGIDFLKLSEGTARISEIFKDCLWGPRIQRHTKPSDSLVPLTPFFSFDSALWTTVRPCAKPGKRRWKVAELSRKGTANQGIVFTKRLNLAKAGVFWLFGDDDNALLGRHVNYGHDQEIKINSQGQMQSIYVQWVISGLLSSAGVSRHINLSAKCAAMCRIRV